MPGGVHLSALTVLGTCCLYPSDGCKVDFTFMSFVSIPFAVFFGCVFAAFWFGPTRWRQHVLLVASYGFCAVSSPLSPIVLAAVSLLGYFGGLRIAREERPRARAMLSAGAVGTVVGILVASRLWGPLVAARLLDVLRISWNASALGLLGVSFFSLKVVGYLIDVQARRVQPEPSVRAFGTFVALFVELPSGPIDRAQQLLPQLTMAMEFDSTTASRGLRLVLWGLFKKLVVGDRLAIMVAAIYGEPYGKPSISLIAATVLFAFQLLADFSGYTDMALGLGGCLGLRLSPNFELPYSAHTVSEFWRRWHISFSSWLRDYLFLPISYAVTRRLDGRTFLGIGEEYWAYGAGSMVTMVLGGLWHGFELHYVLWGAVIATFMIVSVATRKVRGRALKRSGLRKHPRLHKALQVAVAFTLINVSWVFFRAADTQQALYILTHAAAGIPAYLAQLAPFKSDVLLAPWLLGQAKRDVILALLMLAGMSVVERLRRNERARLLFESRPAYQRWALYYALGILCMSMRAPAQSGFIYNGF